MSKTFIYALFVIGIYLLVIMPDTVSKEKESTSTSKSDTQSTTENVDENGVSKGASGQLKYRIGWTN